MSEEIEISEEIFVRYSPTFGIRVTDKNKFLARVEFSPLKDAEDIEEERFSIELNLDLFVKEVRQNKVFMFYHPQDDNLKYTFGVNDLEKLEKALLNLK